MRSRAPLRGAGAAARPLDAPLTVSVMPFLLSSSGSTTTAGSAAFDLGGCFWVFPYAESGRLEHARRAQIGVARSEGCDLSLEVGQALEGAVDAGEAQVGDLVELPQGLEDGQAHLVGGDLGGAIGADGLLDPLGEQLEVVLLDRPALTGLSDTADDLGPAERLGASAALHHGERGLFHRGEAPAALRTRTAPADGVTVVRL